MIKYRDYGMTPRSIVGGTNISKDGEYVTHVLGGIIEAHHEIDRLIEEDEG